MICISISYYDDDYIVLFRSHWSHVWEYQLSLIQIGICPYHLIILCVLAIATWSPGGSPKSSWCLTHHGGLHAWPRAAQRWQRRELHHERSWETMTGMIFGRFKTLDCVYKLFQTDRILPGWYSIDLNRSFLFAMLREYRMFIHFETRMAGCSGWNSASLCYRWWTAVSSIRIGMPCRFAIHGGTWKLVHRNVQPYWDEWPIRYMMIYVTLGYIGLFPTRDKFWFIITE